MQKIWIIGCGGHARSVADVMLDYMPDAELVFTDPNARKGEYLLAGKFPVLPFDETVILDGEKYIIAVGSNQERKEIAQRLAAFVRNNISVISKRAYVSQFSKIDCGCFVSDAAHVGPEAQIGSNCIINTGAVVEHEVSVGAFSHISVNAAICGRSRIGENVFLGAGATVIDKISICDGVIIGAGSVVISDIWEPGVYVGVPARKIKRF